MKEKPKTTEEKIALLRTEYAQSLSGRFAEMNQTYVNILERKNQTQSINELEALSHTLCGSAGTFGFADIAAFCKRVEDCCRLLKKEADSTDILNELSKTLSQLEEAVLTPVIAEHAVLPDLMAGQKPKQTPRLIYILEDDDYVSHDLKNRIEKYGFNVKCFSVVDDFFNAIERELPEAMIIDIMLDNDCGTDALRFLNDHLSIHIPSIVMSSRMDFDSRLMTVRAKADAYLTKPFDVTDIIDILENLLCDKCNEAYRILIVDDVEVMSAYYRIVLERAGMVCHTTNRPKDIMQTLAAFEPELILMDLHMPECRGDELAKLIHQDKTYISLPIVYLSSETSAKEQLNALQMAGDDFLTKPIRPSQLVGAVKARARRYRQIKNLMNKDGLTGLLNHSYLKSVVDKECIRSSRNNQVFSFAMVDMDHFKKINDVYGHATGDIVLKNLSWLFKQRLRKTDVVGRYGGEEFGILMPDTNLEAAEKILNDLLLAFRSLEIKVGEDILKLSFSAGIVSYPDYRTTDDLCRAADKFLYDAKFAGRCQIMTSKSMIKAATA